MLSGPSISGMVGFLLHQGEVRQLSLSLSNWSASQSNWAFIYGRSGQRLAFGQIDDAKGRAASEVPELIQRFATPYFNMTTIQPIII